MRLGNLVFDSTAGKDGVPECLIGLLAVASPLKFPHRGRLNFKVGRRPFDSATIEVGGFPVTKSRVFWGFSCGEWGGTSSVAGEVSAFHENAVYVKTSLRF